MAAAAWPGALGTSRRCSGDSLGRRLLASHALRSQTHLGAGSGAYRLPAAPGSRLLLPPSTERRERKRRSERDSCSNPIPGATAAAAASASATAGEVT